MLLLWAPQDKSPLIPLCWRGGRHFYSRYLQSSHRVFNGCLHLWIMINPNWTSKNELKKTKNIQKHCVLSPRSTFTIKYYSILSLLMTPVNVFVDLFFFFVNFKYQFLWQVTYLPNCNSKVFSAAHDVCHVSSHHYPHIKCIQIRWLHSAKPNQSQTAAFCSWKRECVCDRFVNYLLTLYWFNWNSL